VLLVVHPNRPEANDTAARIGRTLSDSGIEMRVVSAESIDTGSEIAATTDQVDVAADCELVLVLGGEGTFLRAAELARNAEIPVLGVNLGRIGFLAEAEAEAEAIDTILQSVIEREYLIEHRMALNVAATAGDEVLYRGWALNEASLERSGHQGVLGVVIAIDHRPVSAFGCDGVVVSSPTGSTAYAFSAGGPVVWPDLEAIIVVPNNGHALFARPLVTNPRAVISVEVDADGPDALALCDGRREAVVPAGGRLEVTRCETPLKWVRLDSAPFTDRLVRKFRLPVNSWRDR
jgi:NAD+ kinase